MRTPWYIEARQEIGVKEVPGAASNPVIMGYARDAKLPWAYDNDEIAWCAVFVNAMLERQGIKGTRSAWALDFLEWGMSCAPFPGCVAVLSRNGGGHVAFFVGFNEDHSKVLLCGGNQSDMVCDAWFDVSRVKDFRAPIVHEEAEAVAVPIPVIEKVAPTVDEVADELRDQGSRTIAHVDRGETAIKFGVGSIVGVNVLNQVSDTLSQLTPVLYNLKPALDFAKQYQGLVFVVIALLVLYELKGVKFARATDYLARSKEGKDG